MAKYAEGTTVSPESSQMEIKRTVTKYGATGFGYSDIAGQGGQVEFEMHGRRVRFTIRYPDRDAPAFVYRSAYTRRTVAESLNNLFSTLEE